MKLLVSGGAGLFCSELLKVNDRHQIYAVPKEEMNVTSLSEVESCLDKHNPDVFIHAAGLTRPMNKHKTHPDLSILSNIVGTANVVIGCMKRNIKLVYISTDYVYPGITGNYSEEDTLFPVNRYGWSKLGGECSVVLYENSLILRMAMTPKPFVHKKALVDSRKSTLYIDEAATICLKLIDQKGIINVGGPPQSIYDFVKKTNSDIEPIFLKDVYDVKMSKDSTMDITKMKEILND